MKNIYDSESIDPHTPLDEKYVAENALSKSYHLQLASYMHTAMLDAISEMNEYGICIKRPSLKNFSNQFEKVLAKCRSLFELSNKSEQLDFANYLYTLGWLTVESDNLARESSSALHYKIIRTTQEFKVETNRNFDELVFAPELTHDSLTFRDETSSITKAKYTTWLNETAPPENEEKLNSDAAEEFFNASLKLIALLEPTDTTLRLQASCLKSHVLIVQINMLKSPILSRIYTEQIVKHLEKAIECYKKLITPTEIDKRNLGYCLILSAKFRFSTFFPGYTEAAIQEIKQAQQLYSELNLLLSELEWFNYLNSYKNLCSHYEFSYQYLKLGELIQTYLQLPIKRVLEGPVEYIYSALACLHVNEAKNGKCKTTAYFNAIEASGRAIRYLVADKPNSAGNLCLLYANIYERLYKAAKEIRHLLPQYNFSKDSSSIIKSEKESEDESEGIEYSHLQIPKHMTSDFLFFTASKKIFLYANADNADNAISVNWLEIITQKILMGNLFVLAFKTAKLQTYANSLDVQWLGILQGILNVCRKLHEKIQADILNNSLDEYSIKAWLKLPIYAPMCRLEAYNPNIHRDLTERRLDTDCAEKWVNFLKSQITLLDDKIRFQNRMSKQPEARLYLASNFNKKMSTTGSLSEDNSLSNSDEAEGKDKNVSFTLHPKG